MDPDHADADTLALVNAPTVAQERQIVRLLTNRTVRDASFRRQACNAYDNACAVTGLRIVNGGGKAEVQAAHTCAVQDGGPDVVQNGVALSATGHRLFDRHLISLAGDCGLLASHNKVPAPLRGLFHHRLDRTCLPRDRRLWLDPACTQRHRSAFAGRCSPLRLPCVVRSDTIRPCRHWTLFPGTTRPAPSPWAPCPGTHA